MKIAVLADIHANIYALEAVLADAKDESVEHFIIAGDLVGYYYWPQLVVQRLMHNPCITCIRGNHEDILRQTFDSDTAAGYYRQKYGSGYDVCRETLNEAEIQWLLDLPTSKELMFKGTHFAVHHGSPMLTNEYIYPDSRGDILARCHASRDFTILGHTHYPFIHNLDGRVLLNPGSVGQARDLGGQACYALIQLPNRDVRFKRIPFNINHIVTAAKTRDPELPYLHEIMIRGGL